MQYSKNLFKAIKDSSRVGINQEGYFRFSKRSVSILSSCLLLSIVTGLVFLFGPWTRGTEAAWFNDNWAYRKEVPITANTGVDTNTYISFSLDTSALISAKLQSACQDIRITDVNGKLLQYHVGRTNACNNAATTIDALVPTLAAGASTFYVYYGNPSAISADAGAFSQSEAATYTVGTLGSEVVATAPLLYYKFDDATGTSAKDSTSNANNGTLGGATVPTWQTEDQCISAKCLFFDGATSKVTGSKVINGVKTVSMWVRPNVLSSTNALIDLDGGTHKITYDSSGVITATGFTSPSIYVNSVSGGAISVNRWNFVSVTTGTGFDSSSSFTIATDGTNLTQGFMDEVKVYAYARSQAQVSADYSARSNNEGVAERVGSINSPSALSDGLVGYWKEDEASDANATDSSGNGGTLTDTNTVARITGKFFNGADFESGSLEYQSRADTAALSITGSLTLAAWIKPESVTAATSFDVVGKFDGSNESYQLTQFADELRCYIDSASNYVETTAADLATGTWYHTACVYDSGTATATATAKIYVNGIEKTTTTTGTIPSSIGDDAGKFHIGAEDSTGGAANFYDGVIDDIRVYNRNLPGNDIINLFNFGPGPVGYWRFDERTGTSAFDSSGLENTGTLTNSPTYSNGKYGAGLSFAGSNAHVIRADDSDFDFGTASSFSYEAWIKHSTASALEVIIDKYDTTAGNGGFKLQMESDGDLTCGIDDDETSFPEDSATSTAATYDDNNWHHIACVKDGTAGLYLYIDGVLIASDTTISSTGDFANADPLYIGIAEDGTTNDWIGNIDEPKIYNYARTTGQIVQDMNAGHLAPGSPVGSAYGYWKFDEGGDNMCSGGTNDTCNSGNGGNTIDGAESNMAVPATSTSGWQQGGKFGKALAFDGSDDFVSIGDEAGTDSVAQATWSFWTKPGTLSTDDCIWCKVNTPTATPAESSWAIMTDSSDSSIIRAKIANGAADVSQYGSSPTGTLVNGTWSYVAIVYDGTQAAADRLKIFVNGQPVTTTITGTIPTTIRNSTANAVWGRASSTAVALYTGTIDEPKLYLSALTPDQVKLDYNRGSGQVMGALSDNASYQPQGANQEYCVPGDTTSCAAPVARWNFEDRVNPSVTNVKDTSGNGLDINSAVSQAPTVTTGKFGSAYLFNGVDDIMGDVAARTTLDDLATMTAEAWIYPTSFPSFAEILLKETDDNPQNGWHLQTVTGGNLSFQADCVTTDIDVTSTGTLTLNTWQHVAVTYTRAASCANSSVILYINGRRDGTGAGTGNTNSDAAADFNMGSANNGTTGQYQGKIDQVRIYNYIRTPAQIAWDYNRGAPVAWYKMDECQGTTINDSAGNSSTGTLTIGATGSEDTVGTCATSSTAWGNGATGKRNYSLAFDGTDDYVSIADAATNQLSTRLSISAWIKYAGSPSDCDANSYTILNKGRASTTTYSYTLEVAHDCVGAGAPVSGDVLGFKLYDGSTNPQLYSAHNLVAGTWYHVVGTYDGTDLKVYINGILDNTTSSTIDLGTQAAAVAIARNAMNTNRYFSGQIDDARIYNYGLTAEQVKLLYNDGAVRFGPTTGAP